MSEPAWPGTAFVTGASRGIGRAITVALSTKVQELVLVGRDTNGLAATAQECSGGAVETISADLADRGALRKILDGLGDRPMSYVVHAAGDGLPSRLDEIDFDDVDRLFEVNCASFLQIVQSTVPRMRERGFGRIVAVGSLAPLRPRPYSVPYTVTKAALRSAVQCLAVELVPDGILVNMVSPGGVATRLGEAGRSRYERLQASDPRVAQVSPSGHLPPGERVESEDVAEAVLNLLSPANRVVSGQDVVVAGTQVMR